MRRSLKLQSQFVKESIPLKFISDFITSLDQNLKRNITDLLSLVHHGSRSNLTPCSSLSVLFREKKLEVKIAFLYNIG